MAAWRRETKRGARLGPYEVVEGFEFFVNGVMPIGQMKAGGDGLVNAGEVPIAEELGDVG